MALRPEGAGVEHFEAGCHRRFETFREHVFNPPFEHRRQAAEFFADGFGLAHQGADDMVFGTLREDEVMAADDLFALELAVDATVALLHAGRIPRDVEMEEIGAVVLEVHAFARGIRGDQNAQRVEIGRGVEGLFDFVEPSAAGTALIGGDALFGTVGVGEGGFELLAEVRLGFRELGEDQDAAVVPGAVAD